MDGTLAEGHPGADYLPAVNIAVRHTRCEDHPIDVDVRYVVHLYYFQRRRGVLLEPVAHPRETELAACRPAARRRTTDLGPRRYGLGADILVHIGRTRPEDGQAHRRLGPAGAAYHPGLLCTLRAVGCRRCLRGGLRGRLRQGVSGRHRPRCHAVARREHHAGDVGREELEHRRGCRNDGGEQGRIPDTRFRLHQVVGGLRECRHHQP